MPGITTTPAADLSCFRAAEARDSNHRSAFDWTASWRHLEKRLSEGALHDMGFTGFDGVPLIARMLRWIDRFEYPCTIDDPRLDNFATQILSGDAKALRTLGLDPASFNLPAVARYTAQDLFFQRLAVPIARDDRPRAVLDFGAGHGRLVPFWIRDTETVYAADATPGPYLAQRLWARAHGCDVNDYIDAPETFVSRSGALNHLPSWRLDLIPTGDLDLVIAVQVLRELSKAMLAYAVAEFARMLRPGGRLYIRDHIGFHNVNAADLDALLTATGFVLEWRPHLVDRRDIHGLPRIWRRAEPKVILGGVV